VVAPFDGVITSRQVDVGSLVTADVSTGTPLFSIDRTDVLRVRIYVPQEAVFGIKDGASAKVTVPEIPNRVFPGVIARNASSLEAGTRTLLTEVDVKNADGVLHAGLYCTVQLAVPRSEPLVIVPAQAVIFDHDGLSAAVLRDGRIHLQHLDVAADDGAQVEVRAGLNPGDPLVLNPPVGVVEGMRATSIEQSGPKLTAAN
jgi:RND family efflux transporter MFP subunit